MAPAVLGCLLGGTSCAALGQVLFKLGASGRLAWIEFLNPWIGAGLVFYTIGAVLWIHALSKASLTTVYPFTALTFVLVYLAGVVCFGETTSPKAMLGVGFVMLGLLLIR